MIDDNLRFFSSAEEVRKTLSKETITRSFYHDQLAEFAVAENPRIKGNDDKIADRVHELKESGSPSPVWVYYPWRKAAYEILDEDAFISVRTNRNRMKIKVDEQKKLSEKKIAVAGMSVGNAVALTLAMERVGGHLVVADFDDLELSNLNRLRAGIPDIGLSKTRIAERQIAEIDPYIRVTAFHEGVTVENVNAFLDESVDILVEVCDDIELKFMLRERAKELEIPVIMDTNDRGMLDIERFDLDPGRPIFHGRLEGITDEMKDLSDPDIKMKVVQAIVGNKLSDRLLESMPEIGKTLSSWPQLASGVMLGGAVTTDVCRKILLGEKVESGRYFVDFDDILNE